MAIACVGAAIAYVGAGTPSYWGDEAASVLSASRSFPSLIGELLHVDAVHGLYYVFLRFWITVAGTGEAAVRFPSAVAAGLAVAGTVALGHRLFNSNIGLLAGAITLTIPTWGLMGVEARSYAFGMAAAVWLTVLLVDLVTAEETGRRRWVLYAAAAAASMYLFLYLGMLMISHAVAIATLRPGREVAKRWLQAIALTIVLAAPIVLAGYAQRQQIAFLARRHYATAQSALVGQWFGWAPTAVMGWLLIAAAVAPMISTFRRSGRWPAGSLIVLTWVVAPTALLLIGNALLSPMYNLRYASFCVPGVALLMASGVRTVADLARTSAARRGIVAASLVVLVSLAAPRYLAQRTPYAKNSGSDLRQTAQVIASHASPGDAIVFDESTKPSKRPRLALDLYPGSFAGLDDIGLATPFPRRTKLWDAVTPLGQIGSKIAAHSVIWFVQLDGSTSTDLASLKADGFTLTRTIPVHRTTVYKLVRAPEKARRG